MSSVIREDIQTAALPLPSLHEDQPETALAGEPSGGEPAETTPSSARDAETDASAGTPFIDPADKDRSAGTPFIHPADKDRSAGTPFMRQWSAAKRENPEDRKSVV